MRGQQRLPGPRRALHNDAPMTVLDSLSNQRHSALLPRSERRQGQFDIWLKQASHQAALFCLQNGAMLRKKYFVGFPATIILSKDDGHTGENSNTSPQSSTVSTLRRRL